MYPDQTLSVISLAVYEAVYEEGIKAPHILEAIIFATFILMAAFIFIMWVEINVLRKVCYSVSLSDIVSAVKLTTTQAVDMTRQGVQEMGRVVLTTGHVAVVAENERDD